MSLPAQLQLQADELIAARDQQLPSAYRLGTDSIPDNPSRLVYICGLLSDRQLQINTLDATGLACAISNRQYSSEEVAEAFIAAATIVHSATNCLTWLDANRALEQARELDRYLEENGKTIGPLHGVPISVKDFVQVAGFPQSGGHLSSAGLVPQEDAQIVGILRAAGAVFIAKTTMPQSIMHLETSGFYGVTTNAYNRYLTSGGSSGGEGALLGARGSVLGITTDVGGSTRGPAANNGLWGYKPSTKRFPRRGLVGATMMSRIAGSIGPVAHSLRDLELFSRTILAARPWREDCTLLPLPWRPVDADGRDAVSDGWSGSEGKIRIGIMRDDGRVRPVAPVRRALDLMVRRLRQAQAFETVEITQPDFTADAWEITKALYYIDGGEKLRAALGDEPMVPLTEWISGGVRALSSQEVTELVNRRNALRQQYLGFFQSLKIDVLLSPASPAPAQAIGTTKYWNYTSFWNCLDWPAIAFPTGLQVDDRDEGEKEPQPRNEDEKHLFSTFSAYESIDAPIGLQLCAPRWQDERLFAACRKLDELLPLLHSST